MAEGYVMTIPKSVLNKLDQADKKIAKIAETSQNTQKTFGNAFQEMANGVDPLLQKLRELKSLSRVKLDKILGDTSTTAEKAANSIAKVATQLNKINNSSTSSSSTKTSVLAWQGINENIKIQQERLGAVNRSIKEYENTLARINAGKGGAVSQADQAAYKANIQEAQAIQKTISAYELKQQRIVALQQAQRQQLQYEKELISLAQGSQSLPEQRKNDELRKMNQYYKELESSSKKQAIEAEKSAKYEEKAAATAAKRAQAQKIKSDNKSAAEAARAEEMYHRALVKSEATIAQRARKIEALTNAQRALNATGRDYSTQLSKIASETQRLQKANSDAANSMTKIKKSQSKILDITGQLTRQLSLLFSVSSIKGYVDKLVAVRGEFELQQTSLRSILQDKEKADEVWDKTVQLAVKSPFTVKELVTYTKQLAAYRVEADKLYDTNKMLADVSAGLGVSMDRLILAFGQVKAANYLRASEVRQFTEAGVNILGELSTIYTELEGRMVSVAEVQDRITKRMVKFGDVEEVFQRITAAGGIFYNMQEVQAETLAGMMSNLQDTFDLMFNEIGKANDGILKGFVSLLRDIVNSWEKIGQVAVPIIMVLVSRWALLKGSIALAGLANSAFVKSTVGGLKLVSLSMMKTTAATERMTSMIKKSSGASVFGGWVSILSAVALIAWEIYNAISATNESQRKMNRTISEGVQTASEMSQKFKVLADTAIDSTKSVDEQKEALDELKRTYGDIVSAESLRIESLKAMKGEYDAVTAAIYAKIEASTREKLLSQVQEEEGKIANDALEGLRFNLFKFGVSMDTSRKMVNEFSEDIKKGLINSPEEAVKKVQQLIAKYTLLDSTILGLDKKYTTWGSILTYQSMNAYLRLEQLANKAKEISGLNLGPLEFGDLPDANQMNDMFKSVEKEVEEWKKDRQDKLSIFELSEGAKKKKIEAYQKFIKEIEASLKGEGAIKLDERSFVIANKMIEKANKIIDKLKGTVQQQEIERLLIKSFTKVKASFDAIPNLLLGDEEGLNEYVKRFKQRLEYLKEQIEIFNKNVFLSPFSKDQIDALKKEFEALSVMKPELPETQKEQKKSESEADKRLKKQLSLLKEIGKAYEDNLKYYNKEEAAAKTRADYASAAKEAGVGDLVMSMSFDPSGLISGIEEIGKQASKKMKLDVERSIADIKGKAEIEVRAENIEQTKKQLEELFAGYEITVEMGKLGMDKSLISQLFNIDTFSIADIKKKLEQIYPDVAKLSQEQLKVYNETSKKILSFEQKDLEERLKTYSTYLKKSMSERVKIEMEGQKKIQDIPSEFRPDQRAEIINKIKKETKEALDKQIWSDFQASDMYIRLFEDLDNVSTSTLQHLKNKLMDLKGSLKDLPVTELKAVTSQINKVEKELLNRNPFKDLGKNIKSYIASLRELKNLEEKRNNSINKEEELTRQVQLQEKLYKKREEEYQVSIKTYGSDSKQAKEAEKRLKSTYDILQLTKSELKIQGQITGQIQDQEDEAKSLGEKLAAAAEKFAQRMNEISSLLSDIQSSFGSMMSQSSNDFLSSAQTMLGGVGQIAGGLGQMASGNWIGGSLSALGGLAKTIGGIFGIGDKKKERQIQKEIKLVEKLQHSYEKLEKAIENAYTIDTINASYANATKNLEEQIQSYQNMIEAEKSKKSTDWDKINQWENEMDSLREQIDELKQKKVQELGGFGSGSEMKSAAEEFASAWMEAYMETGDGLDALNDKWDEFIQNIVVKQLALRGINKFLEPIMKQIDAAIGDDSYLSTDELAKIKESVEEMNPKLNAYFKDIMEGFGDLLPQPGSNNTELSGLSSSIQGISEEQAGIIEAYLNSVRFFVSDISIETRRLTAALLDESIPNPMLNELRIQTELTRSINSFLDSVIISGHRMGRSGIKVFID